jgi:hypothetical protein
MLKSVLVNAGDTVWSLRLNTGGTTQLSIVGVEYTIASRVGSTKHGIVGWIVGRCHEEARFVCRLCVLEAPLQVDVAVHVIPLLPTLL